ncbi:hypothetical protein OG311_39770 (plasmid) [Streptomyces sp. NBC_01343]|uniref:hypothetical protein n=1 Tax=Streptomyces sp. NBC_01343 TaxID=2903832 RepID=UPI002E162E97|nr:hypothetical protein OG311_39770 [Streptomyces sp. NBC_01343]
MTQTMSPPDSPTAPVPGEHEVPGVTEVRVAGLRVRLVPMPWARSVGGCLAVACGSRDDAPGTAATAHLAEHVRAIAGTGRARQTVPVFAQTDIARTLFRATAAPRAAADLAVRLVDVLGDATVDERLLESERMAVELETARMDSGPLLRAGGLFAAAACDEPGMDAVARTRRADIPAVTHREVADLVAWGYRPGRAVLSVAGPPEALATVAETVERHLHRVAEGTGPDAAEPHRVLTAAPRMCLPALDGLVAVTLTRPRRDEGPWARALLSDLGPVVAAGVRAGVPLVGRTTVENENQAVDVLCWKPAPHGRAALTEQLRAACAAAEVGRDVLARVARETRQERAYAGFTPMAQALRAALADSAAPATATATATATAGPLRLSVWQVAGGVPVAVG